MKVLIDHDTRNGRRLSLRELVRRAERASLTIRTVLQRRSPSGRGWHRCLFVEPAPQTCAQVVALQLLFGSDPLREAYCYNRARLVDARAVDPYWQDQDAWDVLYSRLGVGWEVVSARVLDEHIKRMGITTTYLPFPRVESSLTITVAGHRGRKRQGAAPAQVVRQQVKG